MTSGWALSWVPRVERLGEVEETSHPLGLSGQERDGAVCGPAGLGQELGITPDRVAEARRPRPFTPVVPPVPSFVSDLLLCQARAVAS